MHVDVCVCFPAPVCEGSCQKSTQTSTLKSNKQKKTHTNMNREAGWRRGVGHMLKMSKSRQHVVWKARPATPPRHPPPPAALLYLDIFISLLQNT